jgi:hypothetical protein
MYIKEILLYLMWPLIIWISWLMVRFFIRMYEKNSQEQEQ